MPAIGCEAVVKSADAVFLMKRVLRICECFALDRGQATLLQGSRTSAVFFSFKVFTKQGFSGRFDGLFFCPEQNPPYMHFKNKQMNK
ncbi:hypothetical protein [Pseudomonas asplenii]|uniref:hypothetical protein n=1 Tax=Pseudomonas asplenii TaxID=53407 RepID=UPI0006B61864|nr:hypothetical protein [Pseudomonas fuscovaginae]